MDTLYLGIDIGDRTYSIDATKSTNDEINPVKLPGQKNNNPILSAIGKRKNGKYELLREGEEYNPSEFSEMLVNFKQCPSTFDAGDKQSILKSEKAKGYVIGIKEMLELTLTDVVTRQIIVDLSSECSEIVFCIGYPTNWSEKDVSEFQKIINNSILGEQEKLKRLFGKSVRVKLERESTAAFIYARSYQKELEIEHDTCILVLDFGSSTVNVTALKIGAQSTLYNSGHNFFGGRMIDCLIANYYFEQLSMDEQFFIEDLNQLNNNVATSLILMAACEAKEKLSSATSTRIVTNFSSAVKLTRQIFEELLNIPLVPFTCWCHLISDTEMNIFQNKSWKQILIEYLSDERKGIVEAGICPELVIVTGGGSMLEDVRRICLSLFQNVKFLNASDTTRTISRGLALAARREDKSIEFDKDVKEFLDKKLLQLIKIEISTLAEDVSDSIANYLCSKVIIPRMLLWRDAWPGYETLDITSNHIAKYCTSKEFIQGMQSDLNMQKSIKAWSVDKLGKTIGSELKLICDKYKVKSFTIDTLNIMRMPTINIDGTTTTGNILDALSKVIGVIAGIIAAALAADALVVVLAIIYLFIPELAIAIAEIIAIIPGGLFLLAAIAGVAVYSLIINGWESVKNRIVQNIAKVEIPAMFRKAVTESSIKNSINSKRDEIRQKIKDSILSSENVDNIAKQINNVILKQVSTKLDEIRYAMESI